ncbi:bifunctional folylpolyglutamate synthase/dihydrofolate synthase [Peribacillus sp. SCS-37]|uniref:bifunctional folylpolyglutamate synthase/dihydrofolate synthase n=1 Tax=Paraperibacillus esterisolvens TaxID=3115296 RepID=UPI00390695A3
MFKEFTEVEAFFKTKEIQRGMDFGLDRMRNILNALGNPEAELVCIHIAGSNGKGSTLNFLKEILMAEGLRTGSFTSPHIERLNERIMINTSEISDMDILLLMNELAAALERSGEHDKVTYFEILTLLSIMYFAREKPDIVLFETGLGGRLDSTNVILPVLSIITTISLEHTDILGSTLAEIAREKAGIIKKHVPVICGNLPDEALGEINSRAVELNAEIFVLGQNFFADEINTGAQETVFSFTFGEKKWNNLEISMLGRHQVDNASLALAACVLLKENGITVSEKAVSAGLRNAAWKGRIEVLSQNPLVILDGAHNPEGMAVLMDTLSEAYPDKKLHMVMAVLKDKDYHQMLKLAEGAERITLTEFEMYRSLPAEALFKASIHPSKRQIADWKTAIREAAALIKEDEMLAVTGSLYFISEARPYLNSILK